MRILELVQHDDQLFELPLVYSHKPLGALGVRDPLKGIMVILGLFKGVWGEIRQVESCCYDYIGHWRLALWLRGLREARAVGSLWGSPTRAMDTIWTDVKAALELCHDVGIPSAGPYRHFHVRLDGRFRIQEDSVLLPAALMSSWTSETPNAASQASTKVLVRVPLSTWYCTAKHSKFLRILKCPIDLDARPPVIDATWGTAVVFAKPTLRADETLQTAELFAGGFCGWGQSIRVMNSLQIPVATKWMLDNCADCFDSARFVHGGATLASDGVSLKQAFIHSTEPIFVLGDISCDWWFPALADGRTHIWCASPPCPPWSQASSGAGLQSHDGMLILRLASLMQACQPLCVCLEQVAAFQQHHHFRFVQDCFLEAGYIRVWHDTVELGDFLPTFRRR